MHATSTLRKLRPLNVKFIIRRPLTSSKSSPQSGDSFSLFKHSISRCGFGSTRPNVTKNLCLTLQHHCMPVTKSEAPMLPILEQILQNSLSLSFCDIVFLSFVLPTCDLVFFSGIVHDFQLNIFRHPLLRCKPRIPLT